MKCRSEPQVVDMVTRKIASCGLTISGSLTVSTRRSLTPFQHRARIGKSSSAGIGAGGGLALGRRDLAGLGQGLEAGQRLVHQRARHEAEQLGDRLAQPAARRLEAKPKLDLGAAVARRGPELHRAFLAQRATFRRLPAQELAGAVLLQAGPPLVRAPERAADDPARLLAID